MAHAMGYHLSPASRGSPAIFLFLTHYTSDPWKEFSFLNFDCKAAYRQGRCSIKIQKSKFKIASRPRR
jgi:hypothetical protein